MLKKKKKKHPDVSAILDQCSVEQLVMTSPGCDFQDQMTQLLGAKQAPLHQPWVPWTSSSQQKQWPLLTVPALPPLCVSTLPSGSPHPQLPSAHRTLVTHLDI